MNQHIQTILNLIQQSNHLNDEEKTVLIKAAKELDITSFKLDRTGKVKHTTVILLEETIKELENKRKTIQAQHHELEIEASLERVRAVAMAMKVRDDMPEICKTIALQLQMLGVNEIRNVQTAIFYPEKGTYMNYEFYARHNKTIITETSYTNHKMHQSFANQMLKGAGEFFSTSIPKDELNDWVAYQKTTNVFIDDYLNTASSLNYYWHSLGPVALGISTYEPLKEEETTLFKRFLKVFELSYTRYLDIEKAEAQAREAQIEAALERVRSRSMAMHKSDELKDVIRMVLDQFVHLNINVEHAGFYIDYRTHEDMHIWLADPNLEPFYAVIPYFDTPTWNSFIEAKTNGTTFHTDLLDFEEKNKFYQSLFKLFTIPEEAKQFYLQCKGLAVSTVLLDTVGLYIENFSCIPYTDEENKILLRFGKVFQQTYTRFLDLQKAEAQTRESQIQLALERARAQSMMMQHSRELDDTLRVFHEQVLQLNIPSAFSFLWLPDEEKERHIFWAAWKENNSFKSKAINYPLDRNEPATAQCLVDWKSNEPVVAYHVPPEGVTSYFAAWNELITGVEQLKPEYFSEGLYYVEAFMKYGCFGVMVKNALSEDEKKILDRFATEFERAYTRFLDLQKAEEQAREAQIEAALEKVRSRSLAVHKSDEFKEVVKIVFEKLQELGIKADAASINIFIESSKDMEVYIGGNNKDGLDIRSFRVLYFDEVISNDRYQAQQSGIDFFSKTYNRKEKNIYFKNQFEFSEIKNIPDDILKKILESEQYSISMALAKHSMIVVNNFEGKLLSHTEIDVVKRVSRVFEQAYIRFLDLKKAEAQSRESQIELGLERVRARAMAMQTSEELNTLIGTVFTELTKLDLILTRCVILIYEGNEKGVRWWMANSEVPDTPMNFFVKYANIPFFNEYLKGWQDRSLKWQYALEGENKIKTDDFLFNETELSLLPDFVIAGMRAPQKVYLNASFNNFGNLTLASLEPLSEEHFDILLRFAKVFDLTYTRFNDLQKAEAQTRESQIQLALERVRARTMAMQRSDELSDAVYVLFQQFKVLGENPDQATIGVINENENVIEYWVTMYGQPINKVFKFSIDEPNVTNKIYNAWKENKKSLVIDLHGNALTEFMTYRANKGGAAVNENERRRVINVAFFSKGLLNVQSNEERSQESIKLLERFAAVFEQTYTRFLDLQKAESQARESQIQLALERVRARTMAMQKQNDLLGVLDLLVEQLIKLGVHFEIANFSNGIPAADWDLWIDVVTSNGEVYSNYVHFPRIDHPYFHRVENNIEVFRNGGGDLFKDVFSKDEKDSWQDYICTQTIYKDIVTQEDKEYIYGKPGYTWSMILLKDTWVSICRFDNVPFSDEEDALFRRFANAFGQAYTRFLDLQKAEKQAREAQIEAALEKVRSRTLAMQRSDELAETASELFKQMIGLGIEPSRLYITIINEEKDEADFWITDEDGSKLTAAYTANLNNNDTFRKMYEGWKQQLQHLIIDMHGEDLKNYFQYLQSIRVPFKGGLEQQRRVQHLAYFSKGFIGLASPDEQPLETLQLLERFAYVFNLTFTRFNDLKNAEAHALQAEQDLIEIKNARQKAEAALIELQAAQRQLIQAEKMASLGELTAGIAHEIQNPLNFVNNFSEINNELIEELKAERLTLNAEELYELLNDIFQNNEKINMHGKRADAIVKGMLQHSRKSTGQKEPTDINALCDEYLRLSYHGLRAKDKGFNADFKTDFDNSVGKINIVPQDIGRVLLNLLNNAFYAVNEKQKAESLTQNASYKPFVLVQTKKINDKVEIVVRDNGNGIPQNIIDKIFQPFFTTKPTGQGTGLGLSLAYDIITKEHNGIMKVESKVGEGSKFIMHIPTA